MAEKPKDERDSEDEMQDSSEEETFSDANSLPDFSSSSAFFQQESVVNVYVHGGSMNIASDYVRSVNIDQSHISEVNLGGSSGALDKTGKMGDAELTTPPIGPGWVKLSETTFINNMEPLRKGVNVYKGKCRLARECRDVAIKIIPYTEANFREIKFLLKLEDHPNIVRMLDAGEYFGLERRIFIVMELCSQTLKDFIDKDEQAPIDFQQRFSFAKQTVSGVAHIHKNHILHRDIKLENLLLSPSKENIRVADFGLSKQLQDGHSISTVSTRGLGSDGYRAPEILHENPKASRHSDSFSLGIVLAMLFSNGQHPFGRDPARWRTNILDRKTPDLSTLLHFSEPYLHKRAQLKDLVLRAVRHNPRSRPTPAEMLQHPFFSELSGVDDPQALTESMTQRQTDSNPAVADPSTSLHEDSTSVLGEAVVAAVEKMTALPGRPFMSIPHPKVDYLTLTHQGERSSGIRGSDRNKKVEDASQTQAHSPNRILPKKILSWMRELAKRLGIMKAVQIHAGAGEDNFSSHDSKPLVLPTLDVSSEDQRNQVQRPPRLKSSTDGRRMGSEENEESISGIVKPRPRPTKRGLHTLKLMPVKQNEPVLEGDML